jgi:hypothetical protein
MALAPTTTRTAFHAPTSRAECSQTAVARIRAYSPAPAGAGALACLGSAVGCRAANVRSARASSGCFIALARMCLRTATTCARLGAMSTPPSGRVVPPRPPHARSRPGPRSQQTHGARAHACLTYGAVARRPLAHIPWLNRFALTDWHQPGLLRRRAQRKCRRRPLPLEQQL